MNKEKLLNYIKVGFSISLVMTLASGMYIMLEKSDIQLGHNGMDRLRMITETVQGYTSEEYHHYMEKLEDLDAPDYLKYARGYDTLHEVVEGELEMSVLQDYMKKENGLIESKENRLKVLTPIWYNLVAVTTAIGAFGAHRLQEARKVVKR